MLRESTLWSSQTCKRNMQWFKQSVIKKNVMANQPDIVVVDKKKAYWTAFVEMLFLTYLPNILQT